MTTSAYGYDSDANYFEFLAGQQSDPFVQKQLLSIAKTDQHLSKSKNGLINGTREERWRKRAEECRTLSERQKDEFCRSKLLRLAEAYDLLSGDRPVAAV